MSQMNDTPRTARLDVLAIGTLARNRFWDETADARDEFATACLVRSGKTVLVVDPGWPSDVMEAVLFYRSGLKPEAVTDVFATHLDPAHVRGIGRFHSARWWAHEEELVYARAELARDETVARIVGRMKAAEDHLAPGIDLYPTPGHTPGHASLMVLSSTATTFIAGDAVLTRDHLEYGDLGPVVWDRAQAEASFREVLEMADLVVPGHDNTVWLRSGFDFL